MPLRNGTVQSQMSSYGRILWQLSASCLSSGNYPSIQPKMYYNSTMSMNSGISSSVMFPGGSSRTLSFDYKTLERCWPPFVHPSAKCSGSNFGTSDCECPFVEVHNASLGIPHARFKDFSCRCKGGKYLASEYQFSVTYDTPGVSV